MEIAQKMGITRSSVAVHISNLTKKGCIAGRGYVLRSGSYAVVAGGVNVDIGGRSFAPLVAQDSNPGTVRLSLGGVGRNIAHNLALLGTDVHLLTAYGDSNELFGKADATISLTHALEGGYKFDSWTVTPNTVNVSNNRFTMPQHATTVEAKGTQVLWITQQPEPTTTIIYGDKAILSVTAQNSSGGTDGITYQWYKGTEKLPNMSCKTKLLSDFFH